MATSDASTTPNDDESDDLGDAEANVENHSNPETLITQLREIVDECKLLQANCIDCSTHAEKAMSAIQTKRKGIEDATREIDERLPEAAATIESAEETCGEITELHGTATDSAEKVSQLVDKLLVAEQQVKDLESDLAAWRNQFEDYESVIKGLLPGATSAGLASAFASRKKTFSRPRAAWSGIFVACMAGLLFVAWSGKDALDRLTNTSVSQESKTQQTANAKTPSNENAVAGSDLWPAFWWFLAQRLIFVGPLIWLALYAARQHSLYQRLDEDYGYKETVSRAFEGYKNQLSDLTASGDKLSSVLASDVLGILSERPGRIYDSYMKGTTPAHSAAELVQVLTKSLTDLKASTTDAGKQSAFDDAMKLVRKATS